MPENFVCFAACTETQTTSEADDNGYFTKCITEGISEAVNNKYNVSTNYLRDYVNKNFKYPQNPTFITGINHHEIII